MHYQGIQSSMGRRSFVAAAAASAGTLAASAALAPAARADAAGDQAWDAEYDVVVVGYGLAGGTAARHAADAGAKVLLVDAAPEGGEGGNSKLAKQLLASGHSVESAVAYLTALNGAFSVDPEMVRLFAERMVDIPNYCRDFLGVESLHSWIGDTSDPVLAPFVPEYPELPGAEDFDAYTITDTSGDGALWVNVQGLVAERGNSIDVWYASPARHLVQEAQTRAVVGVVIEHEGSEVRVAARNGVVLACGGYEFNPEMLRDFAGVAQAAGIGTPYNRGDGIRMALEVGADLWHMKSYEPGSNTLMFNPGDGTSPLAAGAIPVSGSTIFVGPDGARYYNEVGENRHGRAKIAGEFRPVDHPEKTWFLWDQTRMDELAGMGVVDALPVLAGEQYTKADTLEELAEACGMDADVLVAQVADWGFFAERGRDYQFGRDAATIRVFDGGPYYAMPGIPLILNTQGGPRRNKDAQVMGADGEPIPHLYSAGELGSMNAFQYQGGCNLSECLIFGRIAGENAAAEKQ